MENLYDYVNEFVVFCVVKHTVMVS
jgi:hypothetical protein